MDCKNYPSPIGMLCITANECSITGLRFGAADTETAESPLLQRAAQELTEYFSGTRTAFDLPLSPAGTAFQQRVWAALREIPYGETRCYQEIAAAIGHPSAYRAVGMANNRNPIPILIPCHRVIGKSGGLTGYAGGLPAKEYLLTLEKGR